MRTGEGAGQKGAGLREEGHGAGSQGYVAATATCPSVNTYPGTCSHTRTHRCPQSLICTKIHVYAQTGSETHTTTHTHIHKYKGILGHTTTRCPWEYTQGTCAATCPPLLLVPSLPHVGILQVAGSYRWAKIVTWHKLGLVYSAFPPG